MQEQELEWESGTKTHCVPDRRLGPSTRDQLANLKAAMHFATCWSLWHALIGVQSHSSGKS